MERTLDTVLDVVDRLYAAGQDAAAWPETMQSIRRLFNASATCFGKQGLDVDMDDIHCAEGDPDYHRLYIDEYAADNIVWNLCASMPVGDIYYEGKPIPRDALRRSRFWNEWMVPQDMYSSFGCKLSQWGASGWVLDVERGRTQPGFEAADFDLMRRLAPTLVRVAGMRERLGAVSTPPHLGLAAFDMLSLGAVVVDAGARIAYLNRAADDLIGRTDGPLLRSAAGLQARRPALRPALNGLIASACSVASPFRLRGGFLHLVPADPRQPDATAFVGPLTRPEDHGVAAGRHALVLIRLLPDETDIESQMRALFGLTSAESRIAAALAGGSSLADIARAQGVRLSTVRTHMAHLLQKTETRQQSQVVALVKGAGLPVRAARAVTGPPSNE